jgi:hypothetical protein
MISGGPIGFDDEEVKFTLTVLRDGSQLQWEAGQFEKRKRVVREILLGCTSEVWKTDDEWALGGLDGSSSGSSNQQQQQQEDPLFTKKGWNKIDSGFRLWGGGIPKLTMDGSPQTSSTLSSTPSPSSVDTFLASKGWNDIDSGFRLV